MFDEATIRFLHGGCSLLVGSVDADLRPHCNRGWGLTVVSTEPPQVRVLVNEHDTITIANLKPGAMVAICTADVSTLRSLQLKGWVVRQEAATADDVAKQQQYTADFTNDINRTDGESLDVLHRWAACSVVACVVDVGETFDQTPGPGAGSRLEGAPS